MQDIFPMKQMSPLRILIQAELNQRTQEKNFGSFFLSYTKMFSNASFHVSLYNSRLLSSFLLLVCFFQEKGKCFITNFMRYGTQEFNASLTSDF